MKHSEMIALGLAGLAVYYIFKARNANAAGVSESSTLRSTADAVTEIFDAGGRAFTNGWRYFSDNTVIDPAGNYYKDGALIWSPVSGATGKW